MNDADDVIIKCMPSVITKLLKLIHFVQRVYSF